MFNYPREEIRSISGRLHFLLYQLRLENRFMEAKFQDVNRFVPDYLDRANNETSENTEISRYNQNLKKIAAIRSAIWRIKTGNYGTCMLCGEEISIKRLMAMPDTNYCIECMMEVASDA